MQQMSIAKTTDYKNMLVQGIMMNFWFDQDTTTQSFKTYNCFENVLQYIFQNIENMNKDFEVKRLVLGLSSLLCKPN